MKKKMYILIPVVFLLVIGGGLIYKMFAELQKKKELAAVQTIESDNSNLNWRIVRNPMGTSLLVLGVKTKDVDNPFVWIVLNRGEDIIIIPKKVEFYISCNDVDRILDGNEVKYNVVNFLNKKCLK